jgi:hypothetical protein
VPNAMQPVIRKDPSNPTDQTIEMQNALIITPRDMHPEATTESASKKKKKKVVYLRTLVERMH